MRLNKLFIISLLFNLLLMWPKMTLSSIETDLNQSMNLAREAVNWLRSNTIIKDPTHHPIMQTMGEANFKCIAPVLDPQLLQNAKTIEQQLKLVRTGLLAYLDILEKPKPHTCLF